MQASPFCEKIFILVHQNTKLGASLQMNRAKEFVIQQKGNSEIIQLNLASDRR